MPEKLLGSATMSLSNFYCYLPVDDELMNWGAYVTSVGRVVIPTATRYPPPGHPAIYDFRWQVGRVLPEFAVILITEGRGIFDSKETGHVAFEGPTMILLFPGVWHRYRPDFETGWTERWVCFNGEIAHRLASQKLFDPLQPIHVLNNEKNLTRHFE